MMVNAVILGGLQPDEKCGDLGFREANVHKCHDVKINQAAFGVASSTLSIIYIAPMVCYTLAL